MNSNKHLLLVAHAPSANARELSDAVFRGASNSDIEGVEVRPKNPFETVPEDVLWADGVILGTPENFGYMSGALKDFFDRIYPPSQKTMGVSPWMNVTVGPSDLRRP